MRIQFLGTGSFFNYNYKNNSALLSDNKGFNLLLDCGFTVPQCLEKLKLTNSIKNIWISHIHSDHVGGLEEIAFRRMFQYSNNKEKINLYIQKNNEKLLMNYLGCTLNYCYKVEDFFNIISYDDSISIDSNTFNILQVDHIPNMKAYMIFNDKFIYTGDAVLPYYKYHELFNDQSIKYIFHEVDYNEIPNMVHTPLSKLIKLPSNIKDKIVLMHYPDPNNKILNYHELSDTPLSLNDIINSFNVFNDIALPEKIYHVL